MSSKDAAERAARHQKWLRFAREQMKLPPDQRTWLRPSEAAWAVGAADRSTAIRLIQAGKLRVRRKPGTGRHREVDPASVVAYLDALSESATRPPGESPGP